MLKDSSTATSKRRRSKASTAMAHEEDDHGDSDHYPQHPPAVATGAAASAWSEEMHSSFLHGLETAFVRDNLVGWPARATTSSRPQQGQQQLMSTATTTAPSLDRYVPDSAESTRVVDGDTLPASVSASRISRRRSRNIRRNECTAGDTSEPQSHSLTTRDKAIASSRLPGPSQELGDADNVQMVPLFEMPETSGASRGKRRWNRDLSPKCPFYRALAPPHKG